MTGFWGKECATISAPSARRLLAEGAVCGGGLCVRVLPAACAFRFRLDFFQLVFAVAQPKGFAVGQLHRAAGVGPAGGEFVGNIAAGRVWRERWGL